MEISLIKCRCVHSAAFNEICIGMNFDVKNAYGCCCYTHINIYIYIYRDQKRVDFDDAIALPIKVIELIRSFFDCAAWSSLTDELVKSVF